MWAWGYNEYSQLGSGSTEEAIFTPFRVYEFGAPIMTAGWYNTVAVSEEGYVQSLGQNNNNQLGDGRTFQRETPYEIDFTNLDKDDNSFDMATALTEDTITEGSVNYISDQDWFSFVPAQTKDYEVRITSSQAATANIYQTSGARPAAVQSRKQVAYQSMTAGQTYYFKVFDKEGLTGGYSIVVKEADFRNAETETSLDVQENELITITLAVGNVRNINQVEFEILYNAADLQPVSLAALNYEPVLMPGVYGPVEILTVGQESVTFRINAGLIPENITWSGVANVLKFSAKKTGIINLQAKLRTVAGQ